MGIFRESDPRSSDVHQEAPPPGGVLYVRRLRRLSRQILLLRGLRPLHAAARGLLGVSGSPGTVTGSAPHRPACSAGAEDSDLVILSANLRHGWPLHRRLPQRLEGLAQMVESEGANVLLLQEVARTADLRADEWLAERLGMGYLYCRVNGHRDSIGFEEGLAVFAGFPVLSHQTRRMGSLGGLAHRLALGAKLRTRTGLLWVFSVHLSLRRRRNARQVSDLQDWVSDVAGDASAVVGGDFNAHETAPQMLGAQRAWLDLFRHIHPRGDGTTHTLRWPWGSPLLRRRLDYLFLHHGQPGWQVVESRRLGWATASGADHDAVVARLRPARSP